MGGVLSEAFGPAAILRPSQSPLDAKPYCEGWCLPDRLDTSLKSDCLSLSEQLERLHQPNQR
jgi:hypothetical protein